VRLKSNIIAPAFAMGDARPLGVPLRGLVFVGGRGETRSVALDDARLDEGCHSIESDAAARWRWTKGELVLDPHFWEGLAGQVAVVVSYEETQARGWIAPAAAAEMDHPDAKPRLYAVG
jgi:hypothetical protein